MKSTSITLYEPSSDTLYSIDQVARITRITRHTIAVYCRLGIVSPVDAPEEDGWLFDDEAIRVLNRAERLRVEHGINFAGIRLVLQLADEVERLQNELRFLLNAT